MNLTKKIALISVYPPPFGGVSVHAKILAGELSERSLINVFITGGKVNSDDPIYLKRISDTRIFGKNIFWHYKIPFIKGLYSKRIKIIHSHEGFSVVPFLFLHRFIFRKSIIHTIHNQWVTERYNQLNFFSKSITNIFLKDINTHWICVNDNAHKQMLELGVDKGNISVIPAYIPAKQNPELSQNDLRIKQTIKDFKNEDKLIGVYGFRISFDSKGQDVYGFNFSIDVFKQLILTKPNTKLIILIPEASPIEEKDKILLKIKNEGLTDNILTIFDSPIVNMKILWDQLDIYFRPTTDDGDSLAVREASANNVAVVASNVCIRPKGTTVFESLIIDSALKCLNEALDGSEKSEINDESYLQNILDVYAKKTNIQ